MDSNKLQAAIAERPVLTLLRDSSEKTQIQFDSLPKRKIVKKFPIPDSFDGRKVWKGMITPIRNQGKCGSCWAFSTTSTLADRFNIQSLGQMYVTLSPTKLILCNFMGREFEVTHPEFEQQLINEISAGAIGTGACHGNTLYDAWRYLYLFGTTTEDCIPYNKNIKGETTFDSLSQYSRDEKLPLCSMMAGIIGDMCADSSENLITGDEYGTPARFYRCLHFYSIAGTPKDGGSDEDICYDIFLRGPVSTGISIYPDFFRFDAKKDIYEWNGKGEQIGGHAVAIVGWGEDKGKKYWIVRNSWGENWGRNGYFYMVRGKNNCQIEDNIISGIPDFFYPIDHNVFDEDENWAENELIKKQRKELSVDYNITGGGIDPTTGYTRRIMVDKPWYNFARPVSLTNLPDWDYFVAGRDSDPRKRFATVNKYKTGDKNLKQYSNLPAYLSLVIVSILFILGLISVKLK
jgi:hypothetical protein